MQRTLKGCEYFRPEDTRLRDALEIIRQRGDREYAEVIESIALQMLNTALTPPNTGTEHAAKAIAYIYIDDPDYVWWHALQAIVWFESCMQPTLEREERARELAVKTETTWQKQRLAQYLLKMVDIT